MSAKYEQEGKYLISGRQGREGGIQPREEVTRQVTLGGEKAII